MRMRIGIMGGTLDPVHNGHIQLAQAALSALKLDGVMLLPAGDPPHKMRTTPKQDRFEMVSLAAQCVENLFACGIEIQRNGTTYTVDTLRELRIKNPNTQWYYIVGADTLKVLESWKDFAQVAQKCTFLVCSRAEETVDLSCLQKLKDRYDAKFICMNFTGPSISSTEIRTRVRKGEDISALVPASVNKYIQTNGLYLSTLQKHEILAKLQLVLKPDRFRHTIGVSETAVRLAKRYGIIPAQAELAALLHDCAKYMSVDEMRSLLLKNAVDVDDAELEAANVLHAPMGAIVAEMEYGVEHPAILSAIRKHTLGAQEMSPLDALIYTADFIEPGRKSFPGLEDARELAEHDLYAAMCMCAELTNQYLETQGGQVHSRSLAMLKHYKNYKL